MEFRDLSFCELSREVALQEASAVATHGCCCSIISYYYSQQNVSVNCNMRPLLCCCCFCYSGSSSCTPSTPQVARKRRSGKGIARTRRLAYLRRRRTSPTGEIPIRKQSLFSWVHSGNPPIDISTFCFNFSHSLVPHHVLRLRSIQSRVERLLQRQPKPQQHGNKNDAILYTIFNFP